MWLRGFFWCPRRPPTTNNTPPGCNSNISAAGDEAVAIFAQAHEIDECYVQTRGSKG